MIWGRRLLACDYTCCGEKGLLLAPFPPVVYKWLLFNLNQKESPHWNHEAMKVFLSTHPLGTDGSCQIQGSLEVPQGLFPSIPTMSSRTPGQCASLTVTARKGLWVLQVCREHWQAAGGLSVGFETFRPRFIPLAGSSALEIKHIGLWIKLFTGGLLLSFAAWQSLNSHYILRVLQGDLSDW